MTDSPTPDDTTTPTAEERAARNERAARRLTMDYPADILQQPTGAGQPAQNDDKPSD